MKITDIKLQYKQDKDKLKEWNEERTIKWAERILEEAPKLIQPELCNIALAYFYLEAVKKSKGGK